jgi:phosphatidylglycerophosphate synthase
MLKSDSLGPAAAVFLNPFCVCSGLPDVPAGTNVPSVVWIAVALLLFLSHTLDGIDGKQARRTGSSTPLGELFDHG